MSDPLSVVLAVYKGGALLGKATTLVTSLGARTTTRFIDERDEMHRGWTAETAGLLAEHVRQSEEAFLLLGGTVEEHARKLEEVLDAPETEVLGVLLGEAAYREALGERRNMLKHAAAAILDLHVSIEEKCRAEKVLRDLDPNDALELDRLSRVAGTVERLGDGKGRYHFDEDRHRYVRLLDSPSADALLSSESIRVMSGMMGGPTAVVTRRGRIILHLLRSYVLPRRRAASGRETLPGERGRDAALHILGAEFRSHVMKAAAITRGGTVEFSRPWYLREYRVQFDFPRPRLDAQNKEAQPIDEPKPESGSRLHIWPCPAPISRMVLEVAPNALRVTVGGDEKGSTIQVDGPFDVLRWLAEDIDAGWA